MRVPSLFGIGLFLCGGLEWSSLSAQHSPPPLPSPTHAEVAYGEHPNQVLDFWAATDVGERNQPLVVYLHGGGFSGGSKDSIGVTTLHRLRAAGFHVAAVEYRLLKHAKLPAAHEDAGRAIQFLRSRATDWKIDAERIGAFGGSAGAQLVAYLAWHDDMAEPDSADPVARLSTRLAAVAPLNAQSTMDLDWWIRHIPGYERPHHPIETYVDSTGITRRALITELSIINHISADDPPVFLRYGMAPDAPIPDRNPQGWMIHHVNFGLAMEEKLKAVGVEVTLVYPGRTGRYTDEVAFFEAKLQR